METKPILDVKNLCKNYGDRTVVSNVSFQIHPGQIFGFLGANGAGKSTTIKMICGLTSITSGDVFIMGKSIKNSFEHAINNVGGVIETPTLYSYMSGYNNLKFFASLYPNISQAKIYEVATLVGLSSRIKDKVSSYSLGMKQRLGIAQVLLNDPKLIILDEPTAGLDPKERVRFRNLIESLGKDSIVLLSTHIVSDIEHIADQVLMMRDGQLIFQGKYEDQSENLEKFYLSCYEFEENGQRNGI